jgi:type I restriction enzyme M protein
MGNSSGGNSVLPSDSRTSSHELKPGYIIDYISGEEVKATPEEVEAVQVFARRLVDDYGYEKSQIQTHPQFRVRKRPSDEEKSYPVDIAVFKSSDHTEANLSLVVECKKKNRRDGIAQLKLYLEMSPATIGTWFNGQEHAYLLKIRHNDGRIEWKDLPNIPRNGQRVEDIGLFRRKDLKKPSNLKAIFRDIRNHLAGMTTGITRDEALAQEIISILFCKILDEQDRGPDDIVQFRAGIGESAEAVQKRILDLFGQVRTATFDDVFSREETIKLDAESLLYVVGELQNYCLMEADRDAVGDAFEVFIGPALRGSEGQFFTPRNVIKMMVDILDPQPGENIIDPASGSGGFLIVALEHVWKILQEEAQKKGWNDRQLFKREVEVATRNFRGIDKDSFLAKVTKAYMAIVGDGRGGVFCENSLVPPEDWPPVMREHIALGTFDVLITNPPMGKKIVVKGERLLSQYKLGYKWKRNKDTGEIKPSVVVHEDQPPQIIFLERCLQLIRPGGRMGIVLPEAVFGMPTYEYVVTFLRQRTKIKGIVSMPEALFKTSGKGGTHAKVCILFLENTAPTEGDNYDIFMADVKWCGHDSRANPTYRIDKDGKKILLDDIPLVADRFNDIYRSGKNPERDRLGFVHHIMDIKNGIFVPKYYDPRLENDLKSLAATHELVSLADFVRRKVLSWNTGIEIGKMAYGTGPIPFIRTSDISNWELKVDPKQNVSEELYQRYQAKQDVQAEDIFVVRDGTYLVGTSCILTEHDTKILYCGGIYKLRVNNKDGLDPYLLLALLNTPIVRRQMRAKQFTRDIIDTLGKRLFEVVLPIPKDTEVSQKIAIETRETVQTRVRLRNRTKEIALEVEGLTRVSEELKELLESF